MKNLRQATTPLFLAICFVLGGSSMAGFLPNLWLQWLALALAAWALIARSSVTMLPEGRQLLAIGGLIILAFALQLVPLPPAVWTGLPGRGDVIEGYRLLRQALPWLPLSLAPANTLASFLWLLPAFAATLAIVRQGAFNGRMVAWVVVGAMVVNALIGALQLAGGPQSPWYFYLKTNRDTAVGLFSNGNHTANLLVCTIPFLAALQADVLGRRGSTRQRSSATVLAAIAFAVVVVGLLLNFSLAGFVLFVPATLASLLLLRTGRPGRRVPRWGPPVLIALTIAAVIAIFVGPFGNNLAGTKESTQNNSRATNFSVSAGAARDFAPLGSGIGTYQNIYRERENPLAIDRTYRNHVHNDYIEIALETGVVGVAIVLLFLFWWGRQVARTWRDPAGSSPYAKAATIATAVLLAHSMVDYPLRTAALSTLFAICCAMLAQRPASRASDGGGARHLSA